MVSPILELDGDQLWSALEQINPVDVLAGELIGRAVERVDWSPGRFVDWHAGGAELALLEDPSTGDRCLLPADGLRASRSATLSALAARQILAPTLVTATVLGTGPAAQLLLGVIVRHVPDICHIAVCPGAGGPIRLEPRVVDQVDLAGIGLSITEGMVDAVFGANLVVVAEPGDWPLSTGHLPTGAVVINATGQDLPDELVNDVDEIYVDDTDRLEDNRQRYVVRSHLTGPGGVWWSTARRRPHIEATLGRVLSGAHSGRTSLDATVLVELLSTDALDAPLASELHRVAVERGLGVRRSE